MTDLRERRLVVLIVDDHDVVHWGVRTLLDEQSWVERCVSARSVEEGVALARVERPDVALIDLFVGDESGADACGPILAASPDTKILLISGAGRISPQAARAAGASGFVAKDWAGRDLARAIRMVGLGLTVFEPDSDAGLAAALSSREREVLDRIASGQTNREIAAALFLSPHTVKEHTSGLYRKLGVRNRAEAVQRAQRIGLLG